MKKINMMTGTIILFSARCIEIKKTASAVFILVLTMARMYDKIKITQKEINMNNKELCKILEEKYEEMRLKRERLNDEIADVTVQIRRILFNVNHLEGEERRIAESQKTYYSNYLDGLKEELARVEEEMRAIEEVLTYYYEQMEDETEYPVEMPEKKIIEVPPIKITEREEPEGPRFGR